jgi:large subunit ribosomal protein L17
MLANMVASLILQKRIQTTYAKAKAAQSVADKMVTLGKEATVQARRAVAAKLRVSGSGMGLPKAERGEWRSKMDVVHVLFDEIAPKYKERNGGYTRVVRLSRRTGDAAESAILELVSFDDSVGEKSEEATSATGTK